MPSQPQRRSSTPLAPRPRPVERGQPALRRRGTHVDARAATRPRSATAPDRRRLDNNPQRHVLRRGPSVRQPTHNAAGHLVGRVARFAAQAAMQYLLVRDVREREEAEEHSAPREAERTKSHQPAAMPGGCCTCRTNETSEEWRRTTLDPALSVLSRQLRETSAQLRSLSHAPVSHLNCEVHAALTEQDSRLQQNIDDCDRAIERFRQEAGSSEPLPSRPNKASIPRDASMGKKSTARHVRFEE
jgi:hypothetical protein